MDYKNDLHSDDDFDNSNGFNDHFGSNSNGSMSYSNNGQTRSGNPNGLSKAELRKTNKPIMEKRRRARINHCLNELKTLILEAMKKDPARHTKLEKADILEMTVKHLQSVQRQQLNRAIQSDPNVIHKFKTGFMECAEEVNRYIGQLDGIDASTRQRLSNHLNNCATGLEQIGAMTNFNNGYRHGQLSSNNNNNNTNILNNNNNAAGLVNMIAPTVTASGSSTLFSPQDFNNNNSNNNNTNASGRLSASLTPGAIQMNGMQLIPSRLPSGELALILPQTLSSSNNNNNTNNLSTNIGGFPTWPPQPPAPQTVVAPSIAPPPTLPLLDAAASLPLMNNFATQLQRMSAFTKPHQTPLLTNKHSNNNNTSINITPTIKLPLMPLKPKFHTTTAAAFHQSLPQNSTTTTSPPLSPISSVSSMSGAGAGDDSSAAITPPPRDHHETTTAVAAAAAAVQQHNFSGAFATPPLSGESSLSLTSSSTASTSGSSSMLGSVMASASFVNLSRGSKHLQQQQVTSTSGNDNRKRSLEHAENADSSVGSLDDEEPAAKRFAASTLSVVVSDVDVNEDADEDEVVVVSEKIDETSSGCKRQMLQDERDCMWRPW